MGSFWGEHPLDPAHLAADSRRVVALASVDVADDVPDVDADLEEQLTTLRAWALRHRHELIGELRLSGTHTEISDQAAAVLAEREGEFEILAVARLRHIAADEDDWQFLATAAQWNGQYIVRVETAGSPSEPVSPEHVRDLRRQAELSEWDRHK